MHKNVIKSYCVLFFLLLIYGEMFPQLKNKVLYLNIQKEYYSFDSVKAYIKNNSNHSIYFLTAYPLPNIQVFRFNDELKYWESGEQSDICLEVAERGTPIEIKSGDSISLDDLVNCAKIDSIDTFPLFRLKYLESYRSIYGKYKMRVSFALEPWTFRQNPKRIYSIDSPVFYIKYSK